MHRCHGVECIVDRHLDFIAAAHADDWPENWRRVAIGSRRLPVNERVPAGHHLEVDRIPLFGWSMSVGIGKRVLNGAESPRPYRAQIRALDANAPQLIAKLRRVRVMG